jgi:hypothetical protein
MIRFLTYFGPIAVLAILVTGVSVIFVTLRGPGLDQESQAFVDCAIPAITANWDAQALIKRASPEFAKARDEIDAAFTRYRKLGRLQAYDGATGDSGVRVSLGGLDISGTYFGRAHYEAGGADLKISLSKDAGDWRIDEFEVSSPLLPAEQQASPAVTREAGAANPSLYGTGVDGFERWCRATFNAWAFRYQSASEVWVAMRDDAGPIPTQELAAQIASRYLAFVDDTDKVRIVLFRTNEKGAEATVGRDQGGP